MSTSLLYHAFGVRGYRYVKTEYVGVKWFSRLSNRGNHIGVRCAGRTT
jgi:hypothetical protein